MAILGRGFPIPPHGNLSQKAAFQVHAVTASQNATPTQTVADKTTVTAPQNATPAQTVTTVHSHFSTAPQAIVVTQTTTTIHSHFAAVSQNASPTQTIASNISVSASQRSEE